MVNRFFQRLRALLPLELPGQCILCGASSNRTLDLCRACEDDLPLISHACTRCALPLTTRSAQYCGQCLQTPPPFERTIAVWHYRPPIAQLISGFKYNNRYSYGQTLVKIMAEQLVSTHYGSHLPDLIVPTPLHWRRQLKRGFNQSQQLAHYLSSRLHVPLALAVKREKMTSPQQSLNARQRRQNLRGAFTVTGNVDGKRLALVDDVMTTGATVTEISRSLLAAGALEIHIWCLARTPH